MNGERPHTTEIERPYITNQEKIFLLFAFVPEEMYVEHPAQMHGAFREICTEYPGFFEDVTFGPIGGPVYSESLDTAVRSLLLNGFIQKQYDDGTLYETDTSDLQAFGASQEAKLHTAGLPPFHKWQEMGERFGRLVTEYRFRPIEDMLVL